MLMTEFVPMEMFGKDHWSLLMFIETRVVDFKGIIRQDDQHMRSVKWSEHEGWQYSTRLNDGTVIDDGHDDWNCVQDLQIAGLVTCADVDSSSNIGRVVFDLTETGWLVSHGLRKWRASGKPVDNYRFEEN